MNQQLRNRLLFFGSSAVFGLACLGLNNYMIETCIDDKGLLISGNLPGLGMLACAVLYGAVLLWTLSTVGGNGSYADNFSRCTLRGILMVAGGTVMALSVRNLGFAAQWQTWLGWGASAAMVYLGICRMLGAKAIFGPGALICLFFMVLVVTGYQEWSDCPRLYTYGFQFLTLLCGMLSGFHRACCEAGIIQRRKLLLTSFVGAACALVALAEGSVYIAAGLWMLGCGCTTNTLPPDSEEEEAETPEAQEHEQ